MVRLPIEKILPLAAEDFIVVMIGPEVKFVEHFLNASSVRHYAETFAKRAFCHAPTCQKRVFVEHCITLYRITNQLKM